MECQIKNCKFKALILYNDKWICGKCLAKLNEREKKMRDILMEDLYADKEMS